jgi:hypothetical protein
MDEKNQLLTTNIWLNYVWNDANLMWNDVRTKHNKTYENLHNKTQNITKHNKTYENLHYKTKTNKTYVTKRKTKQKI